jgi:hypothetical protein
MSARRMVARALDDPTLTMSCYATREDLRMARADAALVGIHAAGYRIVPEVATEAMAKAAADLGLVVSYGDRVETQYVTEIDAQDIWAAMLAAAPKVLA